MKTKNKIRDFNEAFAYAVTQQLESRDQYFSAEEQCEKPNCIRRKLCNSPLCAYHFDIANS